MSDVDAHPHIGLSTLSYLFAGRMAVRRTDGPQRLDRGGRNDRAWRSQLDDRGRRCGPHQAKPPDDRSIDRAMHGLQTWVALPHDRENGAASFEHTAADRMPDVDGVRVVAGSGWSMESPVAVSSPLVLAELRVGELAVLEAGATPELSGTGRAMLLGGEPIGDRFIWWNFVHSDSDRIEQAKADGSDQRFPTVPGDHDPWVPLPT